MRYALSALGADKPGIVAQVTGLLSRHNLNIEDSQMTRLGNFFALHLILEGEGVAGADLTELKNRLGLFHLSLDALPELQSAASEETHQLVVYGIDHVGILAGITKVLAELNINILDLSTKKQDSLYLALLGLEVSPELPIRSLNEQLGKVAREQKVEITLSPIEAESL